MSKVNEAIITPKVIEWARNLCNLTEEEAAKKIGIKKESLNKWEKGEKLPTVNQVCKIASVYKLPLALFG